MVEFAITITLLPKMYKKPLEEQYDESISEIEKLSLDESFTISLIAEITKQHNVHYHGKIQTNTKGRDRSFLSHIYNIFRNRTTTGFISVKEINDDIAWESYCVKNIEETHKHMDRPVVATDGLRYFVKYDVRNIEKFVESESCTCTC